MKSKSIAIAIVVILAVIGIMAWAMNKPEHKAENTVPLKAEQTVFSNEINVLRGAKPGAGTAAWTDAVNQTLIENGFKTNLMGFNTCQDAAKWVEANPDKPYISVAFSDNLLLGMVDSDNPAACNLPVTNSSLVAITGTWYHFICGQGEYDLEYLVSDKPKKIGSWNHPVQFKIVQDQMQDIGATNGNIIGYAAGKDLMQAFVSKDIDYIVLSSENLAKSLPNVECIAASMPTELANSFGRVAYEELNPNVRHNHSGLFPVIVGEHIDMDKVRPLFAAHALKNEQLNALMSVLLPVDMPIEDQVKDLEQRANNLK